MPANLQYVESVLMYIADIELIKMDDFYNGLFQFEPLEPEPDFITFYKGNYESTYFLLNYGFIGFTLIVTPPTIALLLLVKSIMRR
jgi:hypothetical protein